MNETLVQRWLNACTAVQTFNHRWTNGIVTHIHPSTTNMTTVVFKSFPFLYSWSNQGYFEPNVCLNINIFE